MNEDLKKLELESEDKDRSSKNMQGKSSKLTSEAEKSQAKVFAKRNYTFFEESFNNNLEMAKSTYDFFEVNQKTKEEYKEKTNAQISKIIDNYEPEKLEIKDLITEIDKGSSDKRKDLMQKLRKITDDSDKEFKEFFDKFHKNIIDLKSSVADLYYAYCMDSTGLGDSVVSLLRSFVEGSEILKLKSEKPEHNRLKIKLKYLISKYYDTSNSIMGFTFEQQRYSAYWQLFGHIVNGKDNTFPKGNRYNIEFKQKFEKEIMENIWEGIVDKTNEKIMSNPRGLMKLFNDLREKIMEYNTNLVPDTANRSANFFRELENLLMDNDFKEALNIEGEGKVQRLINFNKMMNINTAMSPANYEALLELGERMSELLQEITQKENPWGEEEVPRFYYDYRRFRDILDSWIQIGGENYYLKAKSAIPS